MSTNNFSFKNILVVLPDFNLYHDCQSHIEDAVGHIEKCDCENCRLKGLEVECKHKGEYEEFDQLGYDMYIEDIQEQLVKIGFKSCDKWNNDRNYSGTIIAKWGLEDTDGMIKWLEVVIRSGYYSGANIDWTSDGDFGIESEQNKAQVKHYEVMNRKFDKQVVKLEKILRRNGTEMLKVGQFSNGEAVYEVKKQK